MSLSYDKVQAEFEGNTLGLLMKEKNGRVYYSVISIEARCKDLTLPKAYGRYDIAALELEEEVRLPVVERLLIPDSVLDIDVSNRTFPNLRKIILGKNSHFSTDGRMLYSKDGKELLYSFSGGNLPEVVVPKAVERVAVTAFKKSDVETVTFENHDVVVEAGAFEDTAVLLVPDHMYEGDTMVYCFQGIDDLVLPNHIKKIDDVAFADYAPRRFELPWFPTYASLFGRLNQNRPPATSLKELVITNRKAEVRVEDLMGYRNLSGVYFPNGNRSLVSKDGIIFGDDGGTLLYYPPAREEESYMVPEGTLRIGRDAFCGQKYLRHLSMAGSVRYIEEGAFRDCPALETVEFSDAIECFPDGKKGVLENCENLRTVHLPQNLWYLGDRAFLHSGLEEVELPRGLVYIGLRALSDTNLESVVLPKSLRWVAPYSLVCIPHVYVYEGTAYGLLEAMLDVNSNWKPARLLMDTDLHILVPEDVIKEDPMAELPVEVAQAQEDREVIVHLTRGWGIAIFHTLEEAWQGKRLDKAYVKNLQEFLSSKQEPFEEGFIATYQTEDGLLLGEEGRILVSYGEGHEEEVFEIPDGVEEIGYRAFAGNQALRKVIMPSSVWRVGREAFAGCTALEEVVFSDSLQDIPGSAWGQFADCENLRKVHLPQKLLFLGVDAFPSIDIDCLPLPKGLLYLGDQRV